MNRNYLKGRRAEWRCMHTLEEMGYTCVRAAGSHGIDIVAFLSLLYNPDELPLIRAVSVKATKYVSKKDIKEIKDQRLTSYVSKELWHYKPGEREPIVK